MRCETTLPRLSRSRMTTFTHHFNTLAGCVDGSNLGTSRKNGLIESLSLSDSIYNV